LNSGVEMEPRLARRLWMALMLCVFVLGMVYSLVQPLGLSPDEAAHMKYIKFMAANGRLPIWKLDGGGEAGYEAQHPPLYYAIGALIYRAASGLPENWRWQLERWYSLVLGLLAIMAARGFFLCCFKGRSDAALFATAALGFTPLMLEYSSHINPDVMSVLWCCLILWMSLNVARGEASQRDRLVLGVAFGLGLLTKLTVMGTLPLILLAFAMEPHGDTDRPWERRRLLFLGTMLVSLAVAGWWYIRNSLLYRTPFTHTAGKFGSGMDIAAATGQGAHLLQLTLVNTYLTTWVERAWLPQGAVGLVLYAMISIMLVTAVVSAVLRALRGRSQRQPLDAATLLCGVFLVTLLLSHQYQVWRVDYEFNAGGRYLLNGLAAIQLLVVASFLKMRRWRVLCAVWVTILLAVNLVSLTYMVRDVNPSVAPGWRVMQLTVPYK
jgi:4-amino-4-deoxy-L-arabinose transferase-like glycosyltransferase